ncbi:MAG: copper resistance protein B [Rhodospirillales bacterium]
MKLLLNAAVFLAVAVASGPLFAEPTQWGIQIEQLEHRFGDDTDVRAWDADVFVGSDEVKAVWRTEGEYETAGNKFESLENQARLQVPVSTFFDAVAGVRVDTPKGADRVYGVLGLHGLAPQWFEVDADLFLSDRPIMRFEAEYEALLTNRLILIPSIEVDLPLVDDHAVGWGAFGPKAEIGARLSYDVVDRLLSPYVGVHYERKFGDTKDLANEDGEDDEAFFLVAGTRIMF